MEVTIHEAKTHFSKLLAKVAAGEDVTITSGKDKKPVAKLIAFPEKKKTVRLGWYKNGPDLTMESPFWDPLPDDELALWNSEAIEVFARYPYSSVGSYDA